jgi:hypothetical protein
MTKTSYSSGLIIPIGLTLPITEGAGWVISRDIRCDERDIIQCEKRKEIGMGALIFIVFITLLIYPPAVLPVCLILALLAMIGGKK